MKKIKKSLAKKYRKKPFVSSNTKILWIIVLAIIFLSIGFAAYTASLDIEIGAVFRVHKDIRITNVSTIGGQNGGSEKSSAEYSPNYVSVNVDLPSQDSKFIYEVEVTNFGSVAQGVLTINGYPNNLKIEPLNYDFGSKICNATSCINNFKKNIQVAISYKDDGFNSENTKYDFNINFVFKPMKEVSYNGFQSSWTFPKEVIEGGTFELKHTLRDNQYYKVYSGSTLLTKNDYTYDNNILKVKDVTDNLRIELHYTNILLENEVIGSVTGNGITVTAYGNGVYSIDGTPDDEVFIRLSDCLILANPKDKQNLIPPEYPTTTPILEAGKYYNIDFEEISGEKPDNLVYNSARFVFRQPGMVEGYQLFGYDLFSGFMGSTSVPLEDDLGMYSIYVKPNITFNNYKFKLDIYEIFPDNESNLENLETAITGCGNLTIRFFKDDYYEINGYASSTCYVDLDNRVMQTKAFDTSNYDIKYNKDDRVRINYEYISGYPKTSSEISFALRNKLATSSAINNPKLSSKNYDLKTSQYIENIVSDDVSMFSIYIYSGISFNSYRFRVSSEKIE